MKKTVGYLLTVSLCVTTFSLFGYGYFSQATLHIAAGCLAVFLFSELVNSLNRKGHLFISFLAVSAYMAGFFAVLIRFGRRGYYESGMYFQQWMLTRGDEATGDFSYLVMLYFGCITCFGFFVYYFTQVRYRVNLLLLVSLMPCVLYAKVVAEVDDSYLAVIAILNVLAGVYHTRLAGNAGGSDEKKGAAARIGAAIGRLFYGRQKELEDPGVLPVFGIVFAMSVVLIGALIPRKSDAIYYDRFEDLFLQTGNTDAAAEADLSALEDISGGNEDGYQSRNPRRLFMLFGDTPPYLKRQQFDRYNAADDSWERDKSFAGMYDISGYGEEPDTSINTKMLMDALAYTDRLSPGFLKKYGLEGIADREKRERVNERLYSLTVMPIKFNPSYYLGACRLSSLRDDGGPGRRYGISYFSDNVLSAGVEEQHLADIDLDDSLAMLEEACAILDSASKKKQDAVRYRKYVAAFNAMTMEAVAYREALGADNALIPESVRNLAIQMTANEKWDWEKAVELQTFFHRGSFTYDLEYRPPDPGVEYFLFESMTGSCSDFATAYVLMARSINLPARYVNGFKSEEGSRENVYYVRENLFHGYPEVFIPLMGWRVFEPTVSAENEQGFFERLGIDIQMDFELVSTVITVIVLAVIGGIVLGVLLPALTDILFAVSLVFTPARRRALRRYRRLIAKLGGGDAAYLAAMTPREFADHVDSEYSKKERLRKRVRRLVEELERTLYR